MFKCLTMLYLALASSSPFRGTGKTLFTRLTQSYRALQMPQGAYTSLVEARFWHPSCSFKMNGAFLGADKDGFVYPVLEKSTGRKCAMKVAIDSEDAEMNLEREAYLLGELQLETAHDNVARLVAFVKHEGKISGIVQEQGGLGSLAEIGNSLTRLEKRRVFYQVLSGLAFLHENGIYHRDVKPEKIMLDYEKGKLRAFLIGLGQSSRERHVKGVSGSLHYLPPEFLVEGEGDALQGDIWSAGAAYLYSLTGSFVCPIGVIKVVPEIADYKRFDLQKLVSASPIPMNSKKANGLSNEDVTFLQKMLNLDPNERWSAADLLKLPYFDRVRN